MDITQLKKAVRRYLDSNERYAVMISGSWGIGKTTLWKEHIREWMKINKWQRKDIHVSVFGVTSREEVIRRIHNACFGDWSILSSALGLIADIFTGVLGKGSVEGLGTGIRYKLLKALHSNVLICIDDFERSKISSVELLGVLNDLIEHNGSKVLILADEDKLQNDKEYLLYKEKVVRFTWQIEYQHEFIWNALKSKVCKSVSYLIEDYYSDYLKITDSTKCKNIRVLSGAINYFEVIFKSLNEVQKGNSYFVRQLFREIFIKHVLVQSGYFSSRIKVHDWKQNCSSVSMQLYLREKDSSDAVEPTDEEKYKKELSNYAYQHPHPNFQSVSRYVTEGILDHKLIDGDFELVHEMGETPSSKLANGYFGIWEEDELAHLIHEVRQELVSGKVRVTSQIDRLFSVFASMSNEKVITDSLQDLLEEWKTYISHLEKEKSVAIVQHDYDVLDRVEKEDDLSDEHKEIRQLFRELHSDQCSNNDLNHLGKLWERIKNEGVTDKFEREIYLNEHPKLLRAEIVDESFSIYLSLDNKCKHELYHILRGQYADRVCQSEEELSGLREFEKKVTVASVARTGIVGHHYRNLSGMLKKAVQISEDFLSRS